MRIIKGRVIDPASSLDRICDLYINDGVITGIKDCGSDSICEPGEDVIDAKGKWVVPGLIDMHVHFREPGYTHKETIETGSFSAAAGGFTTVCCMPNNNPVTDSVDAVQNIIEIAKEKAVVNVLPVGSITKNLAGTELSDIMGMTKAGAIAISDDGKTAANAYLMRAAMLKARECGIPVLAHCEDINLVNGGVVHDGEYLGEMRGITGDSEDVIVARDIVLAHSTGTSLHICHVSTKVSIWLLRQLTDWKENLKNKITAEASPHHFTLTDASVQGRTNFKMNPPLRSREDVDAVKRALGEGVVGVIATDHAPHAVSEKNCAFELAANGIIGLETAVGLGISELVKPGILTPSGFIAKLTKNPAKILAISKGTLAPGQAADVTVIDPEEKWTVDSGKFYSKALNTPFNGMELYGKVKYTIVDGKIVYSDTQNRQL